MKSVLAKIPALLTLAFVLSGCSTMLKGDPRPTEGTKIPGGYTYEQEIERFSRGETEYAGLYNNFEFKATILNSEIRNVVIEKRANAYQWDPAKTASEREKSIQEMASTTQVFVAFFTPDNKNDNLTDIKSIWKIYLDAGGRRYEAKITRVRLLIAEIQSMYPYFTRWTTPYIATFDVPTAAIETQTAKFTITGPLGTREIEFPAL
jgi:uncharacterized protein YceK